MQLSVREAARYLNVSEKTIYRWASTGEIPLYKINGQLRFNSTELLEFAQARNLSVSTQILHPEEASPAIPEMSQALESGGIHHRLPGADRESVLRALVGVLKLPEKIDRELLYQVLLTREQMGTTGVGNGIAIPHVRHPLVLQVPVPTVTLCFLATPIDFAAPDKQPVHTLFCVVAPTVKSHMHVLSRLARLIRDSGFAAALSRQAPAGDILAEARRVEAAQPPPTGGDK